MRRLAFLALAIGCTAATAAHAGDKPLYGPAPSWVVPAPAIDAAKLTDETPALVVFDNQQRLSDGVVTTYLEVATRAQSAELLGQMGTVTLPWLPDKGDLTIHAVEILRGSERIDLLKTPDRFTVLRREAQLEQRMMNGMLTATMAAQGLRVGDVLRVAFSVTQADKALQGRVQTNAPVPSEPFRAYFGRSRLSWPSGSKVQWKNYPGWAKPVSTEAGGFKTVELKLPIPEQVAVPDDAPLRYQRLPLIEAASFGDWSDVSRTMAPLYRTEGLIAAASPLAKEVDRIVAGQADPLRRAAAALKVVQDDVRYLLMGMDGGNYVPQSPTQTWEVRYGDCKAKSLMLLAMLRAMDIEAEAVLASSKLGDMLPERLAMPGAFDHVLVRATIAGKSYWLDGTQSGTQFEDIADTPPLRHVLPIRDAGAALMAVPMAAPARPGVIVNVDLDQSAGLDLSGLATIEMTVRGETAGMMKLASTQASDAQKRSMVQNMIGSQVSDPILVDYSIKHDGASGLAVIKATAITASPWEYERGRYTAKLDRVIDGLSFQPDRSQKIWRDIPVATPEASVEQYRMRMRLPGDGAGFTFRGEPEFKGTFAGRTIERHAALAKGEVVVDERLQTVGAEIAPEAVPAERSKLVQAKARLLTLMAPTDLAWRWSVPATGADRYKAIDAAYGKLMTVKDEKLSALRSRASFRAATYDRKGAIADMTAALEIDRSANNYYLRAGYHYAMGDYVRALADAEEALRLEPSSDKAVERVARLKTERGDYKGALAMAEDRIGQGGEGRFDAIALKADILAESGDVTGAITTLDEALTEKPGDPDLLNQRCWIKGTRNVSLDTALKDCTRAIELAESSAAALDSRAMVQFRMNRIEDAKADLNAALESAPGMAASLYLRGVMAKRAGTGDSGAVDLAAARRISPTIDADYKKYGITP